MSTEYVYTSSLKAEEAVIGYLLMYPEKFESFEEVVKEGLFHNPKTKHIVHKMIHANNIGNPVSLRFIDDGSIDLGYTTSCIDNICGEEMFRKSLKRLQDLEGRRRFIKKFTSLIREAESTDKSTKDILSAAVTATNTCLSGQDEVHTSKSLSSKFKARAKWKKKNPDSTVSSVPTGIYVLDKQGLSFNGLPVGHVTVIAGDTGQGKSALAQTMSANTLLLGNKVLYVSMEDNADSLFARRVSQFSGVQNRQLQRYIVGDEENEKVFSAVDKIGKTDLRVIDSYYKSVDLLLIEVNRVVEEAKSDLVVFDYLQLIPSGGMYKSEQQHVDYVFGQILGFAKEHKKTSTVVISQLRRRDEGEPQKRDLYHSGKIEQGSHTIMLIWNPSPPGWPREKGGVLNAPRVDCRIIKIAKQKDGPQVNCVVGWDKNTTTFYDADVYDFRAYQQAVKGTPKIQKKKY